jgi:hypothetical protein
MGKDNKSGGKKKLVTRREFMVASGAVIAAGALSACASKKIVETFTTTPGTTSATATSAATATMMTATTATTATTKTIATTAITGSVELPSGLSPTGQKVANSLGAASVSSSGQFRLNAIEGTRQLAVTLNSAGNPMLLGWPDEQHKVINAHSTAEVLVYMATGLFMLPADAQSNVLDLLAKSPELANIEKAIADTLTQDPAALSKPNQMVDQALSDLVDQLAVANKGKFAQNIIPGVHHGLAS